MVVNSQVSRSWLLVNPSREPDLDAVLTHTKSDEVFLDLEDAVAPNEKEAARDRVVEFLGSGARAWVSGSTTRQANSGPRIAGPWLIATA